MTATAEPPVVPSPTPSPLHLAPVTTFQTLRSFFHDASFFEEDVCRRLEIPSIDHLRAIRDGRPDTVPRDGLDVLIRLFLDNEPLAWSVLERLLPAEVVAALKETGLVRNHRTDPARVVSTVLMYPTQSLHIASDVAMVPDGDGGQQWWDLVYAAITTNTRNFLATMPRTRSEAFLDLCSGTGVAALLAASTFADHAWAVDVAERSTAFAQFNAKLNLIDNVTALTGDVYAPVEGLTFDRIVAHPPYVPSRETRLVYRDGGSDGEDITRRIIAGLPAMLRPGGEFHCTCTATDRKDAPLERRLRAMLGTAADEFDIAVVVTSEYEPTEYYVRLAIAGRGTWPEAAEWHSHFAALGVVKLVYATIRIVRHTKPHAPFTIRRVVGSATGPAELDRLVRAAETSSTAEALAHVLDSRPLLAPHVTLRSEHIHDDGGWAMKFCSLGTDVPFDVRLPCPPEMIAVIGRMDGTRTVRALYDDLASSKSLSDDATIERLASYVHILAAHGLVDIGDDPTNASRRGDGTTTM